MSSVSHANPKAVSTRIETYRVDRAAMPKASQGFDNPHEYREAIRTLVPQQKAELLARDTLLTPTGERGDLSSGRSIVAPDSIMDGEVIYKESFLGSKVAIHATIGGNDFVIDTALEYEFSRLLGTELLGKVGGETISRPIIETVNFQLPVVTQYDGYLILLGQSVSVDGKSMLVTFDQVCITDATGRPIRTDCL
ncbi:MAG TPA: hypothetical protein VM901_08620 [Bdellovibrionota bacterium]|nr:hypothetical protein [Bdellovibrionota bacterium]